MDREKYTTITVSKELKRRLDAIAARNRRSAPGMIEHWCDLQEATSPVGQSRTTSASDCSDNSQPASLA